MVNITIVLGLCAFILLLATFASGLLFYKFHIPWLGVKTHYLLAWITLVSALAHALTVLLLH